jgi:hypothetical protein
MIDLDRLESIFRERYRDLCGDEDSLKNEGFFIDWCDKHKIIMLHPDWLSETLNEGKMKGRVCIDSPEEGVNVPQWLLVPKKLAEKTLVLGYLP